MAIGGNRIIPGNTGGGGGGGAAYPFLVSIYDDYVQVTTIGSADALISVLPYPNTILLTDGNLTGSATLTLAELGQITVISLLISVTRGSSTGALTLTVDDDEVVINIGGNLTIAEGFTQSALTFLIDAGSAVAGNSYGFTVTVSDGTTSIPITLTLDIIA